MSGRRRATPKLTAPFDLGLESVSTLDCEAKLALFRCGCSYWYESNRRGYWSWTYRLHCYPHVLKPAREIVHDV